VAVDPITKNWQQMNSESNGAASLLVVCARKVGSVRSERRFQQGAFVEGGGVLFRVWAPACDSLSLFLEDEGQAISMQRQAHDFFERFVPNARPGALYRYMLPDGSKHPDPASRFQPQDVHGPSEVIDPSAYSWRASWRGRPWEEIVLYELHVGAFTPEGTFRAAIDKLDHLIRLGVTAIELMPIGDFPGSWNWGYDGVFLFAPDSTYGRPDDLKALIDAAHARGLCVLLDVVYNHFGPEGNHLPVFSASYFDDRRKTPWGGAVNFDQTQARAVREFVIDNALYWIEEFNLDGLRLDAVHAIFDEGPRHILEELAERVRAASSRPLHLILENEDNDPKRLVRRGREPVHYTAQWNDDAHHVLHVAATGERSGYYEAYGDPFLLAKTLAEGFGYQGQMMPYRGRPRGGASASLPPTAFVAFIQNHDQIGNRVFGERLGMIAGVKAMCALAATYLLLPQIPMIFMGEEWNAKQPFPFFCNFSGALADVVREGRREEFTRFPEFRDAAMAGRLPDPLTPGTFAAAKLEWSRIDEVHLGLYSALLRTRRERIAPLSRLISRAGSSDILGESAVRIGWKADAETLILEANLSDQSIEFTPGGGELLWVEGEAAEMLGPWSVRWSLERP
jgi:maltooligosyltrehalose trehalohydrolase